MALGSAGLSGTGGSHDKYTPEIWSKRIQSAFEKNTITKQYCLDLTELLSGQGGDVIHTPKLANRAAASRSLTSFAQVTPAGATEDEFTMNVQTWMIDPEFVSDALSIQTKLFMKSQIDGKMQQSLAEAFDTSLLATYTDFTTTLGDNTGATAASPDDIFDALEQLDTNACPKSDRVIILSPKQFWAFVKSDVIPSGDYFSEKAKESGRIPVLGGVPVVVSQNLPSHANGGKVNLVMHKEGIAYAIPQAPRVRSQQTLDHLGETIVGDCLYGAKVFRANAGIVVYGK